MLSIRLPALLCALLLAACGDHSHSSGHAHDDHGHGHGEEAGAPPVVVTHFTDRTELFVEFPALVKGADSPFAAHLTDLATGKPLAEGRLVVHLVGKGTDESFEVRPSATPGIFRPVVVPEAAGPRRLTVEYQAASYTAVHDLGEVQVYATDDEARAAMPEEPGATGQITFLKEQQWKVDFGTAPVALIKLQASVAAPGTIHGQVGAEARITAPVAGTFLAEGDRLPALGQQVRRGDVLGRVAPRLGAEMDVGSLRTERDRAKAERDLAAQEHRRAEELVRKGAVPSRRLDEAKGQLQVAESSLAAADARLAQATRGEGDRRGVALVSPVDGILADIGALPGQGVEPGAELFHVVDSRQLRLQAEVSEADVAKLKTPSGAWFTAPGLEKPIVVGREAASIVAVGASIDPIRRTLPVMLEFANADGRLRVGQQVSARVFTGEAKEAPAVPLEAIVDEAGQAVVFVMVDGEHFERRIVRTGIRDRGLVEIVEGVAVGDRVVTRGAYLVRLAAAGPAAAGHGHAH